MLHCISLALKRNQSSFLYRAAKHSFYHLTEVSRHTGIVGFRLKILQSIELAIFINNYLDGLSNVKSRDTRALFKEKMFKHTDRIDIEKFPWKCNFLESNICLEIRETTNNISIET